MRDRYYNACYTVQGKNERRSLPSGNMPSAAVAMMPSAAGAGAHTKAPAAKDWAARARRTPESQRTAKIRECV